MPPTLPRQRLYWLIQGVSWLLYATLGLLLISLFAPKMRIGAHIVAIQAALGVVMLLTTHGLRAYWRWRGWWQRPAGALLWRLLLSNAVAALASQLVLGSIIAFIIRPPASLGGLSGGGRFLGYVLQTYFVLGLWTAC